MSIVGSASVLLRPLLVFAAFVMVSLGGCAAPPAPPRTPAPRVEARDLLLRLEENATAFQSLVGEAKSRVQTGDKKMSAQQVLTVQKPNRFRSEVLGPFGLLAQVVSDGDQLVLLLPGEARAYQGPPSLQNLRRVTRLPLRLEDLVQILLYQIPVYPFEHEQLDTQVGGYVLTLLGQGGGRQVLYFDPTQRLVRSAYYAGGDLLLDISYGDFSEGAHAFPRALSLESPVYRTSATLSFVEPRLNSSIPMDKFSPVVPQGFEIVPFPE